MTGTPTQSPRKEGRKEGREKKTAKQKYSDPQADKVVIEMTVWDSEEWARQVYKTLTVVVDMSLIW